MKKLFTIGAVAAMFFVLSGCSMMKQQKMAQGAAKKYLEALKAADYAKAMECVSQEGLAKTPKERWQAYLEGIQKLQGKLKKYSYKRSSFSSNNDKTYVTLYYQVEYEKKSWYEKIIVILDKDADKGEVTFHQTNVDYKTRTK